MMINNRFKELAFIFICFSLNISAEKVTLDKIAAIVGDGVVLESQFNIKFQEYIEGFAKQNTNQPLPPEKFLKKQLLESLIVEELLFQKADRFGG